MPISGFLLGWARVRLHGEGPESFDPMWRAALSAMCDASEIRDDDIVTTPADIETGKIVWTAILAKAVETIESAEGDEGAPSELDVARA